MIGKILRKSLVVAIATFVLAVLAACETHNNAPIGGADDIATERPYVLATQGNIHWHNNQRPCCSVKS